MDKNKEAAVNALRLLANEIENDNATMIECKLENDTNYWNNGWIKEYFVTGMKKLEISYISHGKK